MASRFVGGVGAIILLASACGCSVSQQAYDRIALGQPVPGPEDSSVPRDLLRSQWGASVAESVQTVIPWTTQVKEMRAVTDAEGNVFAKSRCAVGGAHCLLLIAGSGDVVLEVQVPSEFDRDPPADWQLRSYGSMHKQKFLAPAMNLGQKLAGDTRSNLWPWRYEPAIPDPPLLRRVIWKRLVAWSGTEGYHYLDIPDSAVEPLPESLRHAGVFLAYALIRLDCVPLHVRSQPEPRMFFGNAADNTESLSELFADVFKEPAALSGIATPGFDKRFRVGEYWKRDVRLRTLGNRRLRLETTRFHMYDPILMPSFAVALGLAEGQWPSRPDSRVGSSEVNITDPSTPHWRKRSLCPHCQAEAVKAKPAQQDAVESSPLAPADGAKP